MKIYNESLNYYNLSYRFLHEIIGIDIRECYPFKDGYCVIDQDGENYLIFKIISNERYKFIKIYDIITYLIEGKGMEIIPMYSYKYRRYFVDESNNDYYVVFNYSNGNYKKWSDFSLDSISKTLKDFYNKSNDIIRRVYNFNLEEDLGILTIGCEVKKIDKYILRLKGIKDITEDKRNKNELDECFLLNSNYMISELMELRSFFRGSKFNSYAEDRRNIRFINGGLSNRSFIYDKDFSIANFYKSSVDLFVKDISILIHNSILHLDHDDIVKFTFNILKDFEGRVEDHLEVLVNYLRLQNYMFKWMLEDYAYLPSLTRLDIQDKNLELCRYMDSQMKLINKISFT